MSRCNYTSWFSLFSHDDCLIIHFPHQRPGRAIREDVCACGGWDILGAIGKHLKVWWRSLSWRTRGGFCRIWASTWHRRRWKEERQVVRHRDSEDREWDLMAAAEDLILGLQEVDPGNKVFPRKWEWRSKNDNKDWCCVGSLNLFARKCGSDTIIGSPLNSMLKGGYSTIVKGCNLESIPNQKRVSHHYLRSICTFKYRVHKS